MATSGLQLLSHPWNHSTDETWRESQLSTGGLLLLRRCGLMWLRLPILKPATNAQRCSKPPAWLARSLVTHWRSASVSSTHCSPFSQQSLHDVATADARLDVAAAHKGDGDWVLINIATSGSIPKHMEMGEDVEGMDGSWRRLQGSGTLWAAPLLQRSLHHALELPLRAILHHSTHGVLDCGMINIQCTRHGGQPLHGSILVTFELVKLLLDLFLRCHAFESHQLHFLHPLFQSCDILDRSLRGALLVGELRDCALQIARLLRKLLVADITAGLHLQDLVRCLSVVRLHAALDIHKLCN
mmetsp:Transcript_30394/g.66861  ORF Transcript_30394/g.66861 Transcript_30394/m.66861 type:complete len:299 (+) Transcript_30394:110-1006(+)